MLAELWQHGIGHVLLSRQLRNGNVAFACFLVNVWCLGVKNVIVEVAPRATYDKKMYAQTAPTRHGEPSARVARKLVEGAVQYALDLGLPPHPDYRVGKQIFGDISAAACAEEYAYGRDGKPFFVAGPFDSPARCEEIARALANHTGPEGHHVVVPLGAGRQGGLLE